MNALAPLSHPQLDLFLLGFIVAASLVAVVFFLRFWKDTRDPLFLAFATFFGVQGFSHSAVLALRHPNEGVWWLFALRLVSVLGVLGAILWKNFGGKR